MRKTALALGFGWALTTLGFAAAWAAPATVTAIREKNPIANIVAQYPGINAQIDIRSGKAIIVVLDASTVVADGQKYDVHDNEKLIVEVSHQASVVTGTFIIVNFDGDGTYVFGKNSPLTVKFAGKGMIDQSSYDHITLEGDRNSAANTGQFVVNDWTSVQAGYGAIAKTIDVREVTAFQNAKVTATNCWVASGFSTEVMQTTSCHLVVGNAVVVAKDQVNLPLSPEQSEAYAIDLELGHGCSAGEALLRQVGHDLIKDRDVLTLALGQIAAANQRHIEAGRAADPRRDTNQLWFTLSEAIGDSGNLVLDIHRLRPGLTGWYSPLFWVSSHSDRPSVCINTSQADE